MIAPFSCALTTVSTSPFTVTALARVLSAIVSVCPYEAYTSSNRFSYTVVLSGTLYPGNAAVSTMATVSLSLYSLFPAALLTGML